MCNIVSVLFFFFFQYKIWALQVFKSAENVFVIYHWRHHVCCKTILKHRQCTKGYESVSRFTSGFFYLALHDKSFKRQQLVSLSRGVIHFCQLHLHKKKVLFLPPMSISNCLASDAKMLVSRFLWPLNFLLQIKMEVPRELVSCSCVLVYF